MLEQEADVTVGDFQVEQDSENNKFVFNSSSNVNTTGSFRNDSSRDIGNYICADKIHNKENKVRKLIPSSRTSSNTSLQNKNLKAKKSL